jgi:hypothetical protein
MASISERRTKLAQLQKLAESRGFTDSYQREQITQDNVVSHKKRAPATDDRYARAVDHWKLSVSPITFRSKKAITNNH